MFGKTLLGACRRLLMVGVLAGMTWAAAAPAQAGPDSCCDNCLAQFESCALLCQSPGAPANCFSICETQIFNCGARCRPARFCAF